MHEIKFNVKKFVSITKNYYYVYLSKEKNISWTGDSVMAELLDMNIKEYINLTESFGAVNFILGFSFLDINQAQNFMNYLNEKYLVALRLCGKI